MTVLADEVRAIVAEIWESMLGLAVEVAPDRSVEHQGRDVCAAVQITGAWEGAVIVECGEIAAGRFASAMLGLDDETPSEAEVHDVMGELANMAGGNVKARVGVDCRLSLPTVVVGADLDLSVPGASVVATTSWVADGMPFSVVVMAKAGPAVAAAS